MGPKFIKMEIKERLLKDFRPVLKTLGIPEEKLVFEHPALADHGDFSTNIAMVVKEQLGGSPVDVANRIVNEFRLRGLPEYISKIEIATPGFINIFLSPETLIAQTNEVIKLKEFFGRNTLLKNKKILLEHTSPNPQTTIMLGHLRNNFLGMSVANLLMASGAKVDRDCIVNDRGVHICRSIFGYLVFARVNGGLGKKKLMTFRDVTDEEIKEKVEKADWRKLIDSWSQKKNSWFSPEDLGRKPDHANLIWYVLGSRAYEKEESAKKQVAEILQAWEAEDKKVWELWKKILGWSEKGYAETYKRIGSIHDWVWYESDLYKGGKEIVEKGLKKRIFMESEGAIVTNLGKYGLSDGVVIKSDGTSTYYVFDLNLTMQKMKKFQANLYIWDIGMEQTLYFKQLFALCEQLGIGRTNRFYHLNYALINFKGSGKMSTRQGNVVMADEILDLLKKRALEIIKSSNQELRGKLSIKQLDSLAEEVAVSAVKYSLLKYARETTIFFDIEESLSLEGDSGPYLQYTQARCRSVLGKVENLEESLRAASILGIGQVNNEELALLRSFYRYPEVVASAATNYLPNLICTYLFELAQKYNNFYNKHRIVGGAKDVEGFRMLLTAATAQILRNGLGLLGITTPERM